MQGSYLYEYAVIRLVPRVHREEFLNMGVILYCKDLNFLQAKFEVNEARIKAFSPDTNILQVREYLVAFEQICSGASQVGPMVQWTKAERFRWLTATRSTVLQTSSVHSGFCKDAVEKLEDLYNRLVLINFVS